MGGRLGLGGALKPGMGALFFLGRMGEDGLLRGYAACMYVEMWVWSGRRWRTQREEYFRFYTRPVRRTGSQNVIPLWEV